MRYFLIKGFKGKIDDKFRMHPSDDFILFIAYGLADLENTLKGVLAKGYRVRNKETLSRRIKDWGGFEMRSIFDVPLVEVKEVSFKPVVEKSFDYYNESRKKEFTLKRANVEIWENS